MKMIIKLSVVMAFLMLFTACSDKTVHDTTTKASNFFKIPRITEGEGVLNDTSGLEVATLAGGCFWKMDACYQQVKGVEKLAVGYGGGTTKDPTYEEVGTQKTGHAESIQLIFDPKIISYREILDIYWNIHDPTQFNREGNDVGNDYRSAVFYHSEAQRKTAESVRDSLDKANFFRKSIITEIAPFTNFYKAEEYHQDYYNLNSFDMYCINVVRPKVKHFEEVFKGKMR
jgi:peptide-methionine (S)-S-oxide reductase